jgi:hypothetical protein
MLIAQGIEIMMMGHKTDILYSLPRDNLYKT